MPLVENQQFTEAAARRRSRSGRREALRREIRLNEELLYPLISPTAVARLMLERRGCRTHLPAAVLRADRRASTVLSERLTAITRERETARTFNELMEYNHNVIRTIRLFQLYRQFQMWQASRLPDH